MTEITVHRLGQVEYQDGLKLQELFGKARQAGVIGDTLLLLEHPPVITLGRGGKSENILASADLLSKEGATLHRTGRGGDVTYHGPGQLVGYPIFQLAPDRKDVRRYVQDLEEIILRTLSAYGVAAKLIPRWIGVWVENQQGLPAKIAAIGVHISRWQTSHGFALNLTTNLDHFKWIVPCGISEAAVTSLERLVRNTPTRQEVEAEIIGHFGDVFRTTLVEASAPQRTVSVVLVRQSEQGLRVLLLRRCPERGGFWQTVTGKCELGETPEAAAAREVFEETGQHLNATALGYVHAFAYGDAVPPVLYEETAFFANFPPNALPTLDSAEHDAFDWVTIDEAEKLVPFVGLQKSLAKTRAALTAGPLSPP